MHEATFKEAWIVHKCLHKTFEQQIYVTTKR
jgi:hypothetical protein